MAITGVQRITKTMKRKDRQAKYVLTSGRKQTATTYENPLDDKKFTLITIDRYYRTTVLK